MVGDVSTPRTQAQHCFERAVRALRGNRTGLAEEEFRAALTLVPTHRDAAMGLAFGLRNLGRYHAAADVLERYLAAIGGDRDESLRIVYFLRECQLRERAFAVWQRWLVDDDRAASHFIGGELAASMGAFERAAAEFDQCLQADPAHAGAWFRRAHVGRIAPDDPFRERLRACLTANADGAPTLRVALLYATAKLAADDGRLDAQMQALREAKALAKHAHAAQTITQRTDAPSRGGWDGDAWRRWVDAECAVRLDDVASAAPGREAIFIVGLPRTGTTLLTRLLSQRCGYADRGELPWFEQVVRGAPPAMYLAHLRQDDAPAAGYIDKNPLNFRYLTWIARVFPEARVICCTRDPRDSALSAYEQFFAHPDLAWADAWEDIFAFQDGYRRLMRRAQDELGSRLQQVTYESLVRDPQQVLSEVSRCLGMPDRRHDPQQVPSAAIATASVWQARQQVSTASVQRWRRYGALLPELLAHYGDQAQARGW